MHTSALPSRPIHWILDWDGTLTQRDTLDALVDIAAKHKPNDNVPETWKRVVQAYLSDYDATIKQLAPNGKLPSDVPGERTLLLQLAAVEQRSIDRVSASGIFSGLTAEVMRAGAAQAVASGRVQPRFHLQEFLRCLKARVERQSETRDIVKVLSVNWSQRFIAGCLKPLCPEVDVKTPSISASGQQGTMPCAKHLDSSLVVDVYANELQGLSSNCASTGIICAKDDHKIISSPDKLAYLLGSRRMDLQTGEHIAVVYVGDSWTDLECLLAADMGICIRDAPMTSSQKQVKDTLERLGIECPHILDAKDAGQWNVVWAKDFAEIQCWLDGK